MKKNGKKRFYATFDSVLEMRMRFPFYFFLSVLRLYLRLSSYEYFYLSIQLTRDINCVLNIGWFVSLQSDLFDFRFSLLLNHRKLLVFYAIIVITIWGIEFLWMQVCQFKVSTKFHWNCALENDGIFFTFAQVSTSM